MEHCKKLVLVPQETVARLQEKPVIRTSGDVVNDLDSQMQLIMKQKVDDNEKWKLYEQALQRYLYFVNERRKPLTLLVPESENVKTEIATSSTSTIKRQLMDILPSKFRNAASFLFDHLTTPKAKEAITWDNDGIASVNGRPLSSIIDFISDAVRTRRTAQVRHWETFASVLKSLHTPLDIIGNAEYREAIQTQSGFGIDDHNSNDFTKPYQEDTHVPVKKSKFTKKRTVNQTKWRSWN